MPEPCGKRHLDIGGRAPYLKNLDITNCSGLGRRVLNVSECPNLEKIHAIGSGITGINLPKHGAIKELYLPNTVNNLSIIDQINLTDNGFKMRADVDATENDYSKLLVIELEKVPGINSYEIMKRAVNL